MENESEFQESQKTPEEVIAELQAKVAELEPKANASSQNFERLKKLEQEKQELESKINTGAEPKAFDPSDVEKRIDDKVSLRLQGLNPEQIQNIERFAKGANLGLLEAAEHPFIKGGLEAENAKNKSVDSTPPPSSRIHTFQGKPVEQVFAEGSTQEKQSAFESMLKGNRGKSNE
jgi:hypothetical protein